MTSREAKFILRAHRADGRYTVDDAVFREALAIAENDPELATWLTREHALDATVANKLDAVQPPPGLRETILAGARASHRPARPAWRQPRWLALAASVALIGTLSVMLLTRRSPAPNAATFAHFAADEYANHTHNHEYTGALAELSRGLGAREQSLLAGLDLSPEQLRAAHCAALAMGDREAFELCFQRGDDWYHLYVTKLDRANHPEQDRRPVFFEQEQFASAAWTDGNHLYAVVTRSGMDALRRVV